MNIKLTTPAQVTLLSEGDIIKRFPCNCKDGPADAFDERRTANIGTYEIRSINHKTDIFSLTSANFRTLSCAAPVDIGRLFISGGDLITENVWWTHS